MDGGKTIPFGNHRQAFKDLFGIMMPTIEHRSLVLYEDFIAGCTFQTLSALSGSPILDNISVVNQTVIGTIFVPAKRTS
jgi:hypothetical protein